MPKGKELDRVLDKYDADGVIAMSKIQRNKMTVEAVSPAQQAAIAISKKEKGEKPEIKEATVVDYILAGIYVTGMMGGLAFIMGYTAYDVYQSDYRGRGLDKKLRQKFSDLKAKLKNKN
jgi:beta-lactamase regulating signal transducer with metallopeptidase domain